MNGGTPPFELLPLWGPTTVFIVSPSDFRFNSDLEH
jgi:hypothetical protein